MSAGASGTPAPSVQGYEAQLTQENQAGQPYSLPAPTNANVSNLEYNAQQLYATSIASTGQLPNPQFVAESLATGSTPDNVSAYGDPTASPYLTAGASGFGNLPTANIGPTTGMPNVYAFDKNAYKQALPGLIQKNQQFSGLGEVPQANVGYYNSIINGDKGEVQNWQSWLSHTGYLQSHPTNGYMDSATEQALQSYFVSLYMPQALYAADPNTKLQATQFLQGLNVDPTQLNTAMHGDPSFQTQLLSGWIQAQGQQDPRKALNDYADQFGKDAIPAGVQQAADPSLLQGAENTVWTGLTAVPDLLGAIVSPLTGGNKISDALNSIGPQKGQSQNIEAALKNDGVNPQDVAALSPLMNSVQGDTGWLPFDFVDQQWNRAILTVSYFAGDNAYAGNDPANKNPFDPSSPLGQHIAGTENDLGAGLFGQDWADGNKTADHIFNFAADSLDPVYWLGGEGAELGRTTQLLDKLGVRSAEKGVVKVPAPLRVGTPVVRGQAIIGDVAKLGAKGLGLSLAKTAGKLTDFANEVIPGAHLPSLFDGAKAQSVKDALTPGMQTVMAKAVDPKAQTTNAFASAVMKVAQTEDHDHSLRTLLGIYDPKTPSEEKAVEQALTALQHVRGAATSKDSAKIIETLNEHFPTRMSGPNALHNMKQAMKSIEPHVIDSLSAGHISRLRTLMGQPYTEAAINIKDPYAGAKQLLVHLHSAGVTDAKVIDPILKKWYSGSSDDRSLMLTDAGDVGKAMDAELKLRGKSLDGWRAQDAKIREGSNRPGATDYVKEKIGKAPKIKRSTYLAKDIEGSNPKDEQGWTASTLNAATKKQFDEWDGMLQNLHNNWGTVLDKGIKQLMMKDSTLDEAGAEAKFLASDRGQKLKSDYDGQAAKVQGMQEALAPTGETRPAPFLSSQLQQEASLPGSAYSLLTYIHSGKFSLQTYEKMAAKLHLDYWNNAWKKLALWQISTQLRVAAGDDSSRLGIEMALDGHIASGLKASAHSMFAGFSGVVKTAKAKSVTGKVGKAVASPAAQDKAQQFLDYMKQKQLTDPDFMNMHKYLQEFNTSMWDTATRDDEHYPVLFANNHRLLMNAPEAQAYIKAYFQKGDKGGVTAATKAAQDFYTNDTRGKQVVGNIEGMTPELYAKELSENIERLYPRQTMKKWVQNGINPDQFWKLWKNDPKSFAHVVSPRLTVNAQAGVYSRLSNLTYHDFMEPFINSARGDIMQTLKGSVDENGKHVPGYFENQIKASVGDNPNWTDERIRATAAMEARQWGQNQLYQGQRSMAGTALRHVFPFYGATANMSKFFLRQFSKHPETTANWLRLFAFADSTSKQSNNNPTESASGLLSALGFSPGDTLGSNLSHMFFFTNDGFASFVPGFGPVFGPVLNGISKDPTLSAVAASIPGIAQQVSQNSGDNYTMFPWLEKGLSGVGLMSPLHKPFTVPVLGGSSGSYQAKLDEKYAQMTADNQAKGLPPPSQADVATELGKEELAGEAVGGTLPFMKGTISDATRGNINTVRDQFDAATTDTQRDKVINSQTDPKMKAYLTYEDPRTPQSQEDAIKQQEANMGPGTSYTQAKSALGDKIKNNKDDIVSANPWILDYTTGVYQSGTASDTSKALTAQGPDQPGIAGFDAALQAGDIAPMTMTQYQNKLSSAWEMQNGWDAYETNVVAPQQAMLSQVAGDTSSAEYKQFDQKYLQPILGVLSNQYPTWYKKFISTTSTPSNIAGYAAKAAPLNAVTTWETMPHFTQNETQRTIMWRKATVLRDQAAGTLEALQVGSAPKVEQDQVYQGLQQQIGQLAQEYPQYASELQAAYFNDWKDIVSYESQLERYYQYAPQGGGTVGG